jgi:cyclase
MLSKRLIACLDVRSGCVVKGVNFEDLRMAGDPAELAKRYNAEGIDEVVVLDVTATIEGRRAFEDTIRAVSGELFIPLTVGGGIRSEPDAAAAIDAGADKVGVNSAHWLTRHCSPASPRYGSQARRGDRRQASRRSLSGVLQKRQHADDPQRRRMGDRGGVARGR